MKTVENGIEVVHVQLYDGKNEIPSDGTTASLLVIDHTHHKIHEGVMYHATANAAGGLGTKATLSFTTPNTTKWAHMLIHTRSNVEAIYTLGEGATITAASGSNWPATNKNRNSTNTSDMISAGSSSGAGYITVNATVTSAGNVIDNDHFGIGRSGGESRNDDEWILKQNTTYAAEVISEAATSEVSISIEWYEHTDL